MTTQAVAAILSRAMGDPSFAELLLSDADKAIADYDLTAEEVAHLKGMSHADFEQAAAGAPEQRKSFGTLLPVHDETVAKPGKS
jgi:hypothetical protein